MNVIFFEDQHSDNFQPLSLSHPVFTLLCGISPIYLKWVKALQLKKYSFFCRPHLAALLREETGQTVNEVPQGDQIFINGRLLPTPDSITAVRMLKAGQSLENNGTMLAFRIASDYEQASRIHMQYFYDRESFLVEIRTLLTPHQMKATVLRHLWDIIHFNPELIDMEFNLFDWKTKIVGKIDPKAGVISRNNLAVAAGARVGPLSVIDASDGPVIIDRNAIIEPYSYIKGPSYIGPNCRIVSARIREGCSFGPVCRVGGEVEESILMGYCNKYHEGFLGHAYLGEWVNLGAMTTNSDLKNNYAEIKVNIGGKMVDTGQIKVGCFIGDHTKTGIGTLLNTGISIGFSCNLYGGGLFAEKQIKSFSWGTSGNFVEYKAEKAIQTAVASMNRRNIKFLAGHEQLFSEIHKQSGWAAIDD